MFNNFSVIFKVVFSVSLSFALAGVLLPNLYIFAAKICDEIAELTSINCTRFGFVFSFLFSKLAIFFRAAAEASEELKEAITALNEEIGDDIEALDEKIDLRADVKSCATGAKAAFVDMSPMGSVRSDFVKSSTDLAIKPTDMSGELSSSK